MKKLLVAGLSLSLLLVGCGSKTDFNQISGQQGNVGGPGPSPSPSPTTPPAQNPPVAQNDAFTTEENQPLSVAAPGVLVNDTVNNAALTFPTSSAQGGTVAGNQDGSFTYTPATDFNGADSFVYTLTNSAGSDSATVTITVQAAVQQGFFVDSQSGNDATGSFETGAPFATVQAAVNAAPVGATIVVRPGTYPGTVDLKDGQRLIGAGFEDINAQGTVKPLFTGPINLADGNTLRGLRIEGTSTGHAIEGSNRNGGTVSHCDVANTQTNVSAQVGTGLNIFPGAGTWTIANNTFDTTRGGISILVDGNEEATFRINDNVVIGSPFTGIVLTASENSDVHLQMHRNTVNILGQPSFLIQVTDQAQCCLDLEDNETDGRYRLVREIGTVFNIEQLDVLTVPKAQGGAGNIGEVSIADAVENEDPTNVIDGFCGF